ncbi:hypothetical protein AK812_SmicGene8856 [Symbiodinium microadriaticum]|uniref:Uncharacterized protein n=1 Tax=Symbiodinium microadriaticum TaxID=2951 RepID=A0A1Q9EK19_SYMMI|nr:hypothetical protein AK812_SmicGene8856 [Symbiodinium microadriaticum]
MVESIMQLMLMMRAVVAIHVAANQNKLILTTHAVPPDNGNSVRQLMQTMRAVAAIQDSKTIRPADADDARRGPVHGGKSEAADADDARRKLDAADADHVDGRVLEDCGGSLLILAIAIKGYACGKVGWMPRSFSITAKLFCCSSHLPGIFGPRRVLGSLGRDGPPVSSVS